MSINIFAIGINMKNINNLEMGRRSRDIRGNLSQTEFSKVIGVSQGTISKIERGLISEANILLRIASFGKTSLDFLLTGRVKGSVISHNEKNLPAGISLVKKVKGSGSAGRGSAPVDDVDVQLAFRDDWLRKFGGPDMLVAMLVEGDSMEPTLMDKDVVVINKNAREITVGGGIYALVWNGKRMIKRLQINPKTSVVRIKSDNGRYADLEAGLGEIRIEGRLIWFGREIK